MSTEHKNPIHGGVLMETLGHYLSIEHKINELVAHTEPFDIGHAVDHPFPVTSRAVQNHWAGMREESLVDLRELLEQYRVQLVKMVDELPKRGS